MLLILPYRRTLATLQAIVMSMIIISGIVFMHKEVTSTGEIITHIHPYDFLNKKQHHHESDDQIQFLNLVFQGSYLQSDFLNFEPPILTSFAYLPYQEYCFTTVYKPYFRTHSRGPPQYV